MIRHSRREAILNLISNNDIATQEEMTERLIALGFDVSQATVSRDIKELNLIKVESASSKYKYEKVKDISETVSPQIINLFKQITTSIECANNIIVVKTIAGNASAAGMAIDQMHFSQILGTVAGDDTVLIVTKTSSDAEIVIKGLKSL